MNRKLDFPALLLFTALLFGAIVRFYPAITNGFPLNDGGMFYTMVQDGKPGTLTEKKERAKKKTAAFIDLLKDICEKA